MQSIEILGCRVDAVVRDAAVERVVALAHGATSSLVVTLGSEMVMEAQHNARFRSVVDAAALVVCDTIGLLLASRLRGGPLRERITGVELIDALAASSSLHDLRLFLLGGRDGVADHAASKLRERYPGVKIVGTRDGYFAVRESDEVAAAIRASGANVLLAGMGSPRQEVWLSENLARAGCAVGIGLGGTFDILAGEVRRAPPLVRRLGLEWLYRLIREPRRWRRQLALPLFAYLALRETAALALSKGKTSA
ncbi:MAG: WecB/TagA/CpsF family glycosyltransferase [Candidatus Eremiobacteraeota bacterium]|nr:WecB/TagA/CpsF family glycosyltransferase [Candidatus Eremiobacteraeota bacterium]